MFELEAISRWVGVAVGLLMKLSQLCKGRWAVIGIVSFSRYQTWRRFCSLASINQMKNYPDSFAMHSRSSRSLSGNHFGYLRIFSVFWHYFRFQAVFRSSKVPLFIESLADIVKFFNISSTRMSFAINVLSFGRMSAIMLFCVAPQRRYLQEYSALGTGGGIYHFRDQIVSGSPEAFFVLNADVCSAFPLEEMLSFQKEHGEPNSFVILGTTVSFYFGQLPSKMWKDLHTFSMSVTCGNHFNT